MKSLYTLLFSLLLFSGSAQTDLRTVYNEGMAAYEAGDFSGFLKAMQRADSLSPEHPTITFNLAAAHAKSGNMAIAETLITKAIYMNTGFKPEEDSDFEGIDFAVIKELKEFLNKEISHGQIAFTNSELDLHPESVAYDPKSKAFFLNSVRKGKILKYSKGEFEEFSSGHWAVMGMKVNGQYLWACEVATNEFQAFDKKDQGKTALLQFDLKTGKLINRYEMEGGHWFGDLIFDQDGNPLISDSMSPIIYTLKEGEIQVFRDCSEKLFNLQGLALDQNKNLLYIADFKVGLHVLDLSTNEISKLSHSNTMSTKGTDGLYLYENSLITIQNGVRPFRVSKFTLNQAGKGIESVEYLDKARPEFGEPTLGVLVGDDLYYVANSPWDAYKDGEFSIEGLKENIVLKLSLK